MSRSEYHSLENNVKNGTTILEGINILYRKQNKSKEERMKVFSSFYVGGCIHRDTDGVGKREDRLSVMGEIIGTAYMLLQHNSF